MSHSERVWPRTKKQPCTDAGTAPTSGHAQPPITFFLRSERDIKKAEAESSSHQQDHDRDNNYGVESLNETLEAAFAPKSPERSISPSNSASGKKRKIGNPVHPKIAAAAQRIISSEERPSSRKQSISSPAQRPLTPSPTRRRVRSESLTSLGRSFTPLRASDASTPRSPSVKSVRLSDEEGSIIDDTASQALHSSSEDDDIFADDTLIESASQTAPQSSIPQLVMPSISMPARRPFTERGKRIPRLKIMVAGPSGTGKTSLIKSIVQVCEDVVHVDPIVAIDSSSTSTTRRDSIFETHASTKSYPPWWSDEIEQGRGLRRRKSMGDSILERNISFIDTPGWDMSGASDQENMANAISTIQENIETSFRRNALTGELSDTDLLSVLSGSGGFQVDVLLYMFHPTSHQINPPEIDALRRLSALTNVVPIIGRADTCTSDNIMDTKTAIRSSLEAAGVRTFAFQAADAKDASTSSPFAVSSALGEDAETMDASVLMSSDYVQPLVSSDLTRLVDQLFDPDNAQWLRHCAVKKFIQWRRDYLKTSFDSHKRELRELALERLGCLHDAAPSSISSVFSSPSGFLVPQVPTPSQRGPSPTPFKLVPAMGTTSQYDFGRRIDVHNLDGESVQLPQWAYNLKIALDIENRERKQLTTGTHERHNANSALIKSGHERCPHTKDSEFDSFDYRDPLGLLALSQRLNVSRWSLLQVVGGCGAVATILVWATRNWVTVSEALGLSNPSVQIPGYAAVSARDNSRAPLDFFKAFLTGGKW
ncbi:hypothetical protein E4T52_13703 [Aureobasidium sp. EXF-3400]|nr:hypothetical protein E4T51_12719 [Aureobasidium sp. EXF-12344]KAI4771282.1 hypothetical protein E4T52_13703 [Aureobasidium sp. EXF-3400]